MLTSAANATRVDSGTSYAAPFASGLAALMRRIDTTLTATELKTLIVAGAVAGGRSVPDPLVPGRNIPVVDAYETLKLVAQRPGASLCGNRVWAQGQTVMAERANGTVQTLFTVATADGEPRYPSVYHGGRHIRFRGAVLHEYNDTSRTWRVATQRPTLPEGAVSLSRGGESHDREVTASWTDQCCTGGRGLITVRAWRRNPVTGAITWSDSSAQAFPATTGAVPDSIDLANACELNGSCVTAYFTQGLGTSERVWASSPAVSPRGDFMLIGVNRESRVNTLTSAYAPCPNTDYDSFSQTYTGVPVVLDRTKCRSMSTTTSDVRGAIYRIDLPSMQWQPSPIVTLDVALQWIAINEEQTEITYGAMRRSSEVGRKGKAVAWLWGWDFGNKFQFYGDLTAGYVMTTSTSSCADVRVAFRAIAVPANAPRDIALPKEECDWGAGHATFAPRVSSMPPAPGGHAVTMERPDGIVPVSQRPPASFFLPD